MEGEKRPLNEVKVLLVGDGGAGKTSLVKRLIGEDFDGNEYQTQGSTSKNGNLKIKIKRKIMIKIKRKIMIKRKIKIRK